MFKASRMNGVISVEERAEMSALPRYLYLFMQLSQQQITIGASGGSHQQPMVATRVDTGHRAGGKAPQSVGEQPFQTGRSLPIARLSP